MVKTPRWSRPPANVSVEWVRHAAAGWKCEQGRRSYGRWLNSHGYLHGPRQLIVAMASFARRIFFLFDFLVGSWFWEKRWGFFWRRPLVFSYLEIKWESEISSAKIPSKYFYVNYKITKNVEFWENDILHLLRQVSFLADTQFMPKQPAALHPTKYQSKVSEDANGQFMSVMQNFCSVSFVAFERI